MSVPFYKKALPLQSKKWAKKYTRFSARDDAERKYATLRVSERRNCAVENGVLRAGLGLKAFTLLNGGVLQMITQNANPQAFFRFRNKTQQEEIGCLTKTGDFYIYRDNKWVWRKQFKAAMHAFVMQDSQGGDTIAFLGDAGYTIYSAADDLIINCLTTPFLPVGCFVQGRVFGAVALNEVAYFSAFDFVNTTADNQNVGKIRLPESAGEIVAMVGLQDRVAVFCAYSIFVIQVRGNGGDFVVEKVLFDGSRIFGESVCLLKQQGGKIAFLTENGVYLLQGESVKKLGLDIEIIPKRVGQVCDQGVADGKYVLKYVDEKAGERCVVIDVESESGYTCFLPDVFCDVDGNAACVQGTFLQLFTKGGSFPSGETAQVKWYLDGDAIGKKTLKSITLAGKGEALIRVAHSTLSPAFESDLIAGAAMMKLNVQGETFAIACTMSPGSEIRACRAEFCALKNDILGVKK